MGSQNGVDNHGHRCQLSPPSLKPEALSASGHQRALWRSARTSRRATTAASCARTRSGLRTPSSTARAARSSAFVWITGPKSEPTLCRRRTVCFQAIWRGECQLPLGLFGPGGLDADLNGPIHESKPLVGKLIACVALYMLWVKTLSW